MNKLKGQKEAAGKERKDDKSHKRIFECGSLAWMIWQSTKPMSDLSP